MPFTGGSVKVGKYEIENSNGKNDFFSTTTRDVDERSAYFTKVAQDISGNRFMYQRQR